MNITETLNSLVQDRSEVERMQADLRQLEAELNNSARKVNSIPEFELMIETVMCSSAILGDIGKLSNLLHHLIYYVEKNRKGMEMEETAIEEIIKKYFPEKPIKGMEKKTIEEIVRESRFSLGLLMAQVENYSHGVSKMIISARTKDELDLLLEAKRLCFGLTDSASKMGFVFLRLKELAGEIEREQEMNSKTDSPCTSS